MQNKKNDLPKIAKAGAVFFLCWLAGFGVSALLAYSRFRWPASHGIVFFLNQIFFYDQTALPRGILSTGGNRQEVLSGAAAIITGGIFWLTVGFAFAWLTRRLRIYFTVPLAVISICAALFAGQAGLYFLGLQIAVTAP